MSIERDSGPLEDLAAFGVDPVTGFVPSREPLRRLPESYAAWEEVAPNLSALIRSRRVRRTLEELPTLSVERLGDDEQRERAFLLLTVFANAFVWGGDEPVLSVPPSVALPLCGLASILDRPPIVHYASMALRNWRLVRPADGISADNMTMQVQFLGGVDEDWFFMGSLAVELAGAPALRAVHAACVASTTLGEVELAAQIEALATGLDPVLAAVENLRRWCDPYVFYNRVRPFLAGWPAPGVTYGGVSDEPKIFVGGSAGQSSLLQSIDAVLGVCHRETAAGEYLRRIRGYMPTGHRAFVEQLERRSAVRDRATRGSHALKQAYNLALDQVDLFRRRHLALARDFVARPSGLKPGELGTGGTDFAQFLGDARQNTRRTRV